MGEEKYTPEDTGVQLQTGRAHPQKVDVDIQVWRVLYSTLSYSFQMEDAVEELRAFLPYLATDR